MRLASWVSIVVIAFGIFPLFYGYVLFLVAPHNFSPSEAAMIGEKFVIFGLATLTISEIFRSLKDTKSGGRHE